MLLRQVRHRQYLDTNLYDLFVLNNSGYHSIYQTQLNNFNGALIGCSDDSGVSFPALSSIAVAYGLPYFRITSYKALNLFLSDILERQDSFLCEVVLGRDYTFMPKAATSRDKNGLVTSSALENLFPFLDDSEIRDNVYKGDF